MADHGTSEQFHSELKSDLGVEHLPSGKFCVNQIVMLCAMLAFNTLRVIGQQAVARAKIAPIRIKVSRWRLKTVLQNIAPFDFANLQASQPIELRNSNGWR